MRGEYREAVAVLAREAERIETLLPSAAGGARIPGIFLEISRIYSTYLGDPYQAWEAADRVRRFYEPIATGARAAATASSIASAYYNLARLSMNLHQPVAALDFMYKAMNKYKENPNKRNQLMSLQQALPTRARFYVQLGDYEAALQDWDEMGDLLRQSAAAGLLNTGPMSGWKASIQNAVLLSEKARIHALAGNLDKALTMARDAVASWASEPADRLPRLECLRRSFPLC